MGEIKLEWLGHSCWAIETEGYRIVMDPYGDGVVPGYPPLRAEADQVIPSHDHSDHGAVECVKIREGADGKTCPFSITEIHSYHDDTEGSQRGKNIIHILEKDGIRIAHMGDIGCMPTEEQKELLKNIDVMLMPVGGFFTLEPADVYRLVQELQPKTLVPMHYRTETFGYDAIGTLEAYTKLCDDVVFYDSNVLVLPGDLKKQTAVLKPVC